MRALAAFIMRGRSQAVLVTVVSALLSVLLTPFSYLSGAAVGLVTLRLGFQRGLQVAGWATLATALLSWLLLLNPVPGPMFFFLVWLPVVVMAASLRRTVSLSRSMALAGLFGMMAVVGFYIGTGDPAQWWQSVLEQTFTQLGAGGEEMQRLEQLIPQIAPYMTGTLASALTLSLVLCLLLARWWQGLLYNPGGFGKEFHGLRLGTALAAVGVLFIAGALVLDGWIGNLLRDFAFIAAVMLSFQGLGVAHGVVAASGVSSGWLVGLYLLTILAPLESGVVLLAIGTVDNWIDFRVRFAKRTE